MARAIRIIVTFVLLAVPTLLLASLLCLNTPPVRAFIVDRVNVALAETIAGRIEIARVGWIDLAGVSRADARVFDPHGALIIDARGIDARINVPRLLWALLVERADPLFVRIDHADLEHAEVVLAQDATGTVTLASSFQPRTRRPLGAPPGRTIIVAIDDIEVGHSWVHGKLSGLPALDGEVTALRGAFHDDPTATHLRVESAHILARGLPGALDPKGRLNGRLHLPKSGGHSLDATAAFQGRLARSPARAEFKALGSSVYGTLTAGPIEPAALMRLAPGLSPRSPLSLWTELQGTLPELSIDARIDGRAGVARGSCVANLEEPKALRARLVAERLDLFELVEGAPKSEFGLVAETSLTLSELGDANGTFSVEVAASDVAGFALPPITTTGTLEHDPTTGVTRALGQAAIDEPGAATRVDLSFVAGRRATVELRGRTVLESPPRLRRDLGVEVFGLLETEAQHELGSGSLEADARLSLRRLERMPVASADLVATAHVSGRLSDPLVVASLRTGQTTILGRGFSSTHFGARGKPERLSVTGVLVGLDATRVQLATTVAAHGPALDLLSPSVSLTRASKSVNAEARAIQIGPRRVEIDELVLTGAGRAELSLSFGKRLERLEIMTQDLDLAELGRLVDPRLPLRRGRATIEGHFAHKSEPELSVRGQVVDIYFGKIAGASVATDLLIQSGHASGSVWARLAKGGDIVAAVDDVGPIRLPLSRATLPGLVGKLALKGDFDLSYLAALVPLALLPTDRASGRVTVDLELARDSRDNPLPNVIGHIHTRALSLVGKRRVGEPITTTTQARRRQPWAVREVDLEADLRLGEKGDALLAARARDREGELMTLSLTTALDASLVRARSSWPRAIWTSDFDFRLRVPKREIARLPAVVRPVNTQGVLTLNLQANGTLRDPTVRLAAEIDAYRSAEEAEDKEVLPLNVTISAAHAESRGTLTAEARTRERSVATLKSQWQGQPTSLLDGDPLRLGAQLSLKMFPLDSVPALRARSIGGNASGEVRLQGLGENAALEARLSTETLRVGGASLDSVFASLKARDGSFEMRAKLLEAKGSAELSVDSDLTWGKRLTPVLSAPAHATAVAKNFRVAVLLPLVEDFATEIDGRLDGNLKADLGGDVPTLEGSAELRDGAFNVAVIGQRFHSIAARVLLRPGELRLEQLKAKGISGRIEGTGVAHFKGLALERAEAHVRIPRNHEVPLTHEGVSYGDAWGRVNLALTNPETGPLHTTVDVQELHVELPRSVGSQVQDLDPAEHIKIGMQRSARRFVLLPLQPFDDEPRGERRPMVFDLKLGNNVWVRKGTQVAVQVTGNTSVTLSHDTSMTGQIRLTGGTLDVSGKRFEIDRGTVTFDGDEPTNPTIFATARWDAPDGEYRVFAEYLGRAKNGKLLLRSEPSLSQDQILSLILFGSAEGQFGATQAEPESQTAAATAIGVAGGVATQGLTRALSDITELDVSARIDTSSGASRPEIMVQVSPRIAAKVSYSVGEPSAGQSPDRTFFSLEFRLRGNLSVLTTVGDKGASSLELVWRRRY